MKEQLGLMKKQDEESRKSAVESNSRAMDTLKAIQGQAAAMEKQIEVATQNAAAVQKVADAARMNAEITMAVQRPVVQLWNIGFNRGRDPFPCNTPLTGEASVVVTMRNHGLTRAVNLVATGRLVIDGIVKDFASPTPYNLAPTNDINVTFDPLNAWLPSRLFIPIQQGTVNFSQIFSNTNRLNIYYAIQQDQPNFMMGPKPTDEDMVFEQAAQVLWNPNLSSDLRAALYKVLADTPGVQVKTDATDSSGRPAVEISRYEAWSKQEVEAFEDAKTGDTLESAWVGPSANYAEDLYLSVTYTNTVPPDPYKS